MAKTRARSKANPKADKPKPRGPLDYRMSEGALLEARFLWELQGVDERGKRYTQARACKEAGITRTSNVFLAEVRNPRKLGTPSKYS